MANKVVTSIKKHKKKRQYEVSFGLEKFLLSEDTFTDFYLYVGKEISPKDFIALKNEANNNDAYAYTLNLLSKGRYSTYEIKKKLQDKYNLEKPYQIIERLKKNGLLDDKEYAIEYKEEKESQLYGSERIKDDLLHKKMVSEEIVNSLSFNKERDNVVKRANYIEKKFDRYPLKEKKRKAVDALIRRGYPASLALEATSSYKENTQKSNDSFEKDFASLSKRYKTKYSGYAYRDYLFQALYRRGYSSELIKEKMEEDIYDD